MGASVEFDMATFFSRRGSGGTGARKPSTIVRVGHVYLDARRRVLYCLNETARQLIQEGIPLTQDELSRRPLRTLDGEVVRARELPLMRAWREGTAQEGSFLLGSGPIRHLTWSAAPLFDTEGQIQGITSTLVVTPPEPDWQHLAGLAHDLRTPLQALRLLTLLLESMPLVHPEAHDMLDKLRSSAERAMSIGMDLLEWCRGPVLGGRRVQRNWFALAPFLAALAGEQEPIARRKGIQLRTDLSAADRLEAHCDGVRLGRLLSNLLTNAVRYTSQGEVRFTATWRDEEGQGKQEQSKCLVLSVVDTGSGFSAEDQESIFQPYERGKAGKESKEGDSGGSGVGLAVVDRLVEELGLTLDIFSEYGHGSKFELLLPSNILRPVG
jgi:signal transduction histidine kinase